MIFCFRGIKVLLYLFYMPLTLYMQFGMGTFRLINKVLVLFFFFYE
jgi:hypothetical protein